MVRNKRQEK